MSCNFVSNTALANPHTGMFFGRDRKAEHSKETHREHETFQTDDHLISSEQTWEHVVFLERDLHGGEVKTK